MNSGKSPAEQYSFPAQDSDGIDDSIISKIRQKEGERMDRNTQHKNYLRAHIMKSRWYKVFIAAAAVVVFITTYMLILPAITLDAHCGQEEHVHSDACYTSETTVICGSEEYSGHTHSDECYQTTEDLICGQEESEPVVEEIVNEETGEVETVIVSEGHTHSEDCYQQNTELICGQEETAGHTHDQSCYREDKTLSCGQEEHTHTEECYHEQSDFNADVENEEIWKQTFAHIQLTGNWSEDIVAIAETQIGYQESTKNFVYDSSDEKDGYTRYGAWYGDTYGEWCAMFASFCVYYAEVGYDVNNVAFPLESNCANWINKLQQIGYYHDAASTLYMDQLGRETYIGEDYFLEPGDLIFFNLKNSEYVVSDHVGIVTDVTDKKITTIQGNSNYSVVEKDYNVGDVTIIGFGEIPENPNYIDPDKVDETEEVIEVEANEAETEKSETSTKKKTAKKITSTVANADTEESDTDEEGKLILFGNSDDSVKLLSASNTTATDMTKYITSIAVEKDNGGRWSQATEFTDGDSVRFNMTFDIPNGIVTADNPSISYTLPQGLLRTTGDMSGSIMEGNKSVGIYTIETDESGSTQIVLTYTDPEFIDGISFTGTLFFTGEVATGSGQKETEYSFDGTDTTIKVKEKDEPYDLKTEKSSSQSDNGNTIDYSVKLSTVDGTDGPIIVTDSMYLNWIGDGSNPATYKGNVSVNKYDSSGNQSGETQYISVSGSSFEFELPALTAGEYYELSYSADVNTSSAADDGSLKITNYVNGKLKNHDNYSKGDSSTEIISETKIQKYGSYNQITGQMDFTITVNNPNEYDLSGHEVVDIVTTEGVTLISDPVITDESGKVISNGTLTKNSDGLFQYKFPSGAKEKVYYIKYSTSAPDTDGSIVNNKVTYNDGGEKEYNSESNPTVNKRKFGLSKSPRNSSRDTGTGLDNFEWRTDITVPTGVFTGYFYEDTIMDAVNNDGSVEDSHYGILSVIRDGIQNSFTIKVIENGKEVEKKLSDNYVDIEIHFFDKSGNEVTEDDAVVKSFTVNITPKTGVTVNSSNINFTYNTVGSRDGFGAGEYRFPNEGKIGNETSTPNHTVDNGNENVSKAIIPESSEGTGTKLEWEATQTFPEIAFPEDGYLYEDYIDDGVDENGTSYPGTHYGTADEIIKKIQETFRITILENLQESVKNWDVATSQYVDIEILCYAKEGDQTAVSPTDTETRITYFTVKIKPKSGSSFIANKASYRYETHTTKEGMNGGKISYNNTAEFGSHSSTAGYSKNIRASLEKQVYSGMNDQGQTVPWEYPTEENDIRNNINKLKSFVFLKDGAEISYDQDVFTYRILVEVGDEDQDLTIVDQLPDGMEYIEGSARATAAYLDDNKETNTTNYESTFIEDYHWDEGVKRNEHYVFTDNKLDATLDDSNKLTLTLKSGYQKNDMQKLGGFIAFYYQVRITDPAWDNAATTKKAYVNSVEWEGAGKKTSHETKIVRPVKEVSKTATPILDETGTYTTAVKYDVVINPTGEDLNSASDILELVDTMNPGMGSAAMQLESIKLYEYDATTGKATDIEINSSRYQYTYDLSNKQLSISIPDELPCVLRYIYDINSAGVSKDYEISNSISLMGKDSDSNSVNVDVQESGATSVKPKITVYKVDEDNYGKRLENVEFRLEYADASGNWVESDKTFVTNSDGQILFYQDSTKDTHISQDTLYRLVEIYNPNKGYVVDETPYYFVWLDTTLVDGNPHTTADSWYSQHSSIKVSSDSDATVQKDEILFVENNMATIFIENEYREIAVKKVWVDSDGTDLENPPENVTVQLNKATSTPTGKKITLAGKSYWLAEGSTVTITSPEMWKDDNRPNPYNIVGVDESCILSKEIVDIPQTDSGNCVEVYVIDSSGLSDETTIKIGPDDYLYNDASTWYDATLKKYEVEYTKGEIIHEETIGDPITLDSSNNWSYSWNSDELDKDAVYTISEITIGGKPVSSTDYQITYRNNGITTGEIIVENKKPKQDIPPETTEFSIEKKWIGEDGKELNEDALNGKKVTFKLMRVTEGDVAVAEEYLRFTLPDNDGNWTKEFTDIPKTEYDSAGNATHYTYYFEEVADENTEPTYQKESFWNFLPFIKGTENAEKVLIDEGSVTVTNKVNPRYTEVTVEKQWKNSDGTDFTAEQLSNLSDVSVSVDLFQVKDTDEEGSKYNTDPIILKPENQWKYSVDDLIKEEYKDGKKVTYRYYFIETAIDGYKTTYKTANSESVTVASNIPINGGTFTVINTQQKKDEVSVTKQWFKKNADGSETLVSHDGTINFNIYRVATEEEQTHEHSWGEWIDTKVATEDTEGEETRTCSECGKTETRSTGTLEHTHSYTSEVTKEATCTEEGIRTYTCIKGDSSYTEAIATIAHTPSLDRVNVKEATATEAGYTGDIVCAVCDTTLEYGEVIPATGDDSTNTVTVSITTSSLGRTWATFSDIPANSYVIFRGIFTDGDWLTLTATSSIDNSSLTVNRRESDGVYIHEIPVYVTQSMSIDISWGSSDLFTWSYELNQGSSSVNSASKKVLRSSTILKANKTSNVTQSANIPSNAVKLNDSPLQLHAANGWTWSGTFDAEPGYTYQYYVEEIDTSENWEVSYEGQGTNNLTIKNTITENPVELPHTGGSGTKLITMLGILLMAAASGLMILKKHRKEVSW